MKASDVHIREMLPEDFSPVLRICDLQLGRNYLDNNQLKHYISDDTKHALVAMVNNEVVGFHLGAFTTFDILVEQIGSRYRSSLLPMNQFDHILFRKTTAISPDMEGKGIASMLSQAAIESRGGNRMAICSLVWLPPNEQRMPAILERDGYVLLCHLGTYWKQVSIDSPFDCVYCGAPPCLCDAAIYWKVVDAQHQP